jgi:hypothetical protein
MILAWRSMLSLCLLIGLVPVVACGTDDSPSSSVDAPPGAESEAGEGMTAASETDLCVAACAKATSDDCKQTCTSVCDAGRCVDPAKPFAWKQVTTITCRETAVSFRLPDARSRSCATE